MQSQRVAPRSRLGVLIGLLFLAGPVADLARADLPTWRTAVLAVVLAAFVALYSALLPPIAPIACHARGVAGGLAGLAGLTVGALAVGAPHSFLVLAVYVVAPAGMLLRTRTAVALIVLVAGFVATVAPALGESPSTTGSLTLTVLAIGAMMAAFGRQIRTNVELRAAREEVARLAATEERLRIARDVHDLLGHSLSVVALKTELAAKLLARDPERAAGELADVQRVTRTALEEVRQAVQGYRRLALDDAVDGARACLAAAGIDCDVQGAGVELPEEVESVLAWAVREATTNVVRHSGARACTIRIRADDLAVEVEVEDDGAAAPAPGSGTGLAGLAERADRLRGTLEAGRRPEGGFRLRLSLPLAA